MTRQPNLQTNIYTGYIEELIYENGAPTLKARIRVPSVHGTASRGLKTNELPIGYPLLVPGVDVNVSVLLEHLESTKKVMTMFEAGNSSALLYFGLKATPTMTQVNQRNTTVLRYDNLFLNPPDPLRTDVIYWDTSTDMLYYVDENDTLKPFFDNSTTQGDTLVGVLKVATNLDLSNPMYETNRVVDGHPCQDGDYALSLNSYESARVYMWSSSSNKWIATTIPQNRFVYHITNGNTHAGNMLKIKTNAPYYTIVKASEYQRWVV